MIFEDIYGTSNNQGKSHADSNFLNKLLNSNGHQKQDDDDVIMTLEEKAINE